MPASANQQAKRAFVAVLLTLAASYSLRLPITRESEDDDILRAFRRVALKVHPDKGGQVEHAQALNAAKEAWDKARSKGGKSGRPKATAEKDARDGPGRKGAGPEAGAALASAPDEEQPIKGGRRVHSLGVLLTYNGVQDQAQWLRFVAHVKLHQCKWKIKYWCCTLEANKAGKLHIHLFLQFRSLMDRDSKSFSFEGLTPNAAAQDILGEGFCKKKMQESLDRGFFYCWANKIGTQIDPEGNECTSGNYAPAWTDAYCTYAVKGQWPEKLWKAYKLEEGVYKSYLFLCRDGVVGRKRNFDACNEEKERLAHDAQVAVRAKRIRSNPQLFKPFPEVPEARTWLQCFMEDQLRYPFLVVLGRSRTGKTEWAQTLFTQPLVLKVGSLEHFPDGMRKFRKGYHDGIVLDDLRDMRFLVEHQEKVQGKYNAAVEFASTPSGQHAYVKDLFATPVVVTANYSTRNLQLLEEDDFLGHPENRRLLHFPPAPPETGVTCETLTFL